jgi:chromosome segregation ATPase
MRSLAKIIFPIVLIVSVGCVSSVLAQQSAQERAANLRIQLEDLKAKQDELQTRLQELDEALKPENIASALAGVGSVHPEELREQRRRQLTNEKTGVQAQLDQLAISRTRIEKALQEADARAYQESARPNSDGVTPKGPNATSAEDSTAPVRPVARHRRRPVKKHKTQPKKPKPVTAPSNQ